VLVVWEPYVDMLARTGALGMGMGMGSAGTYADSERIDASNQRVALDRATEGAQRASTAGLAAVPRCESRDGGVANTILAAAAGVESLHSGRRVAIPDPETPALYRS